jgi:membrane protein YqaA with SNARE-associated domain
MLEQKPTFLGPKSTSALLPITDIGTYPFLVGGVAFALTMSMLMPFVPILIGAVLARRDRWIAIVLLSSIGSAAGGLVLYLTFHHLGWSQILESYPDLLQSQAWTDATRWVTTHGTWALFIIAASPVPQTPALIFAAVSSLPIPKVFLALLLGKLIKYGLVAWTAAKFPSWFWHLAAPQRDSSP